MRRIGALSLSLALGLFLPQSGAFADDAAPTPTPVVEAAAPAGGSGSFVSRDLEALWYRDEPDKSRRHGTTRIRATILPNPERHVRVGVLEEYSGATGAQWRTSVWVASFIAATSLGKELTEYRYDISSDGFIDGPSAGALMAVGFMAAITGDYIRSDVTMTGALAPDGSVVAVGGIPEKIHAAKAVGKKRVGIPAGQATATAEGGKTVDVIALGKEVGVEVVEISDVYQAYELLTGKTIKRPSPVSLDKMSIGPELAKLLRARSQELMAQTDADLALLVGDKTPGVAKMAALGMKALKAARSHFKRDEPANAYKRASRAAALAKTALRVAALLGVVEKYAISAGSVEKSADAIDSLEKDLDGAVATGKTPPLVLMAGYSAIARARGFLEIVRSLLGKAIENAQAKYKTEEKVLRAVQQNGTGFLPAMYLSYADLSIDLAREVLKNQAEFTTALTVSEAAVASASRALVSAASGNIEYIDALLLTDVAKQKNMTLDQVRVAFASNERSYLLAIRLAKTAVEIGLDTKLSLGGNLSRLEKAASSYVESALVVAKYYSLDADVTKPDEKLRRDKALLSLLQRAELGAREAASASLEKLGVVPPEALLLYQAGLKEAAGKELKNKLRALRSFWRSSTISRVAVMVLSKA